MIKIDLNLSEEIVEIVEKFPTRNSDLLSENSYFRYINGLLKHAGSFLEIGYRKGMFVEVCKFYKIPSIHVDITDKLLRAAATSKNKCITSDSVSFLKKCSKSFDLIFQDGSKDYRTRQKEYKLIFDKGILNKSGTILVDDLHYTGCRRAFDEIKTRCTDSKILKIYGKSRKIGILLT